MVCQVLSSQRIFQRTIFRLRRHPNVALRHECLPQILELGHRRRRGLDLSIYDEPLVSHGVRGVNRWPVPWEGLALRQDISHSFGYSTIVPPVI